MQWSQTVELSQFSESWPNANVKVTKDFGVNGVLAASIPNMKHLPLVETFYN
jgi:hypothetical protein